MAGFARFADIDDAKLHYAMWRKVTSVTRGR